MLAERAELPLLGITMGDPAGIGPEVTLKALAEQEVQECCRPIVIGSASVLERDLGWLKLPLRIVARERVADATFEPGTVEVLDLKNIRPEDFEVGKLSAAAGRAAMAYVLKAFELTQSGEISAIVTAPINKEATALAGYKDMGHMELFARLTGTTEQATMLATGNLRVVHLTTHYSLREAIDKVTRDRVLQRIRLTDRTFKSWGWERPRIGVAALNPHAGEGGLLGTEEIDHIAPAVQQAQAEGIDVSGPWPADSIFNRAIQGAFDAVIAMYHDQGHIPVKVHGFERSISVALGLPFIRTSVDHGTAFDIAGKGIASHESMVEAIKQAAQLVRAAQRGQVVRSV